MRLSLAEVLFGPRRVGAASPRQSPVGWHDVLLLFRSEPHFRVRPISEVLPYPYPFPSPPSCKAADRWGSYDGAKPTGALCGPCRDTWWLGYSYMTQEALVEAAAADASPLKACFDSARSMVSQKNALEHRLAEVSKDTHIGVRVVRTLCGHTKATFEKKYGMTPAAAGHKPVDLADEHGDGFQCYVVDAEEPRTIQVFHEVGQSHREFWQSASTSLHSDQGAKFFQHITKEPKSSLLRKLGKARPDSVVRDGVARAHADAQAKAALENSDDSSAVASSDDDEGDGKGDGKRDGEAEQDSDAIVPAVPVVGSAVGRSSSAASGVGTARSMSPCGSARKPDRSSRRPAPSTAGRSDPPGFPNRSRGCGTEWPSAEKLGPARCVSDHLLRLPLDGILGGLKLGTERRWAQRFYDENHQTDLECELLRRHLEATDSAMALASGAAITMAPAQYDKHLSVLVAEKADFPTTIKKDMVERSLRHWLASATRLDDAKSLLVMLMPWTEVQDDPDEEVSNSAEDLFDPYNPSMRHVEGSVPEKGKEFRAILFKRVLAPMVKAGEEQAMGCAAVLRASIDALEGLGSIDEQYGEIVYEVLRTCRLLLSVVHAAMVPGAEQEDLVWFRGQGSSKCTERPVVLLSALVLQTPYYASRLEVLERYGTGTLMYGSEVQDAIAKIGDIKGFADSAILDAALDLYLKVDGKILPNISEQLKTAIATKIEDMCAGGSELLAGTSGGSPTVLATVAATVSKAQQALGYDERREVCLEGLKKAEQSSADAAALIDLVALSRKCLVELNNLGGIEDLSMGAILAQSERCKGMGASDVGAGVADIKALCAALTVTIGQRKIDELSTIAGTKDIGLLMSMRPFVDTLVFGDMTASVPFGQLAEYLERASAWAGAEAALRASLRDQSCITDEAIIKFSVAAQQCRELTSIAKLEVLSQLHGALDETSAKTKADAMRAQVDAVENELKEYYAENLAEIKGGSPSGGSWAEGLSETASFATLVSQAQGSLMKVKGADMQKVMTKTRVLVDRFLKLHEMYDSPIPPSSRPSWLADIIDGLACAQATIVSGVMLTQMRANCKNLVKLKSLIRGQLKIAALPILGHDVKDKIHKVLMRAADDAAHKNRCSWPAGM